ncbi:MAG: peptide ABC transporter substrate-binding protein [Candidatus Dadabacteria bacterium]|nr:peptide ABC transporter substrate-binding protein [Candidatus Dadabacteria bacterium]
MKNLLSVLCFLLFISCGSGNKATESVDISRKDTLNINIGTEPPTLDWSLATDVTSFTIVENIMDGLAAFDEKYEPVPALARSWQVSEDGRTYTFKIREKVLWTDGVPLRAGDFLYSWKRLLQPETAGSYAYFLFDIKNARKFNSGEIKDFGKVGIKVPDERTLIITLERPRAYFLSLVTFMSTFPIRKDIVEKYGARWTEAGNMVTLGPYRLKEWKHHKEVLIEEYGDYWGERPRSAKKVKMIMNENPVSTLALYESGELDFLDSKGIPLLEVPRVKKLPDFRQSMVFRNNYIGFNTQKKPFDNPLVRKAFASSIDRKSLSGLLQGAGVPVTSWIPIDMLAHNPLIGLSFNPIEARKFLERAGYPDGKNFPQTSFLYPDTGNNRIVAEAFQSMWKAHLGISVRLVNQEWAVYLSTLRNDPPPVFRAGWQADFPDPHNFMNLFECGSGNNRTGWCDPEYDWLVETAAGTLDRGQRGNLYDRAQKILTETGVAIVPYLNSVQQNMIKPYVKGLEPDRLNFLYFSRVEFVNHSTSSER